MTTMRELRNARFLILPVMALLVLCQMPGAGLDVLAQPNVVENSDNSVSLNIEGRNVTLPASLTTGIRDALQRHSGDSQGLRSAIQAITTATAADAEACGEGRETECEGLIIAIAVFAVLESDAASDPAIAAVIVEGVVAGAPAVSQERLLAALGGIVDSQIDAEDTIEDPQSVSPSE